MLMIGCGSMKHVYHRVMRSTQSWLMSALQRMITNTAQSLGDIQVCNPPDYHNLYLGTDALLLDVFENFRRLLLAEYKLNPVHSYTSPGLSWDTLCLSASLAFACVMDFWYNYRWCGLCAYQEGIFGTELWKKQLIHFEKEREGLKSLVL